MKLSVVLTFAVPHDDVGDYVRLPQVTKDRVDWLLGVMKTIAAAGKGKVAVCERIAAGAGMSRNTIYNLWKSYRDSGDWRVLIDRRRTSEFWLRDESKRVGLPHEFVQEWKTRVENNDRAARPAWNRLIRDWRQWRAGDILKAIPGYDRAPDPAPGSRYPRGWTYSNLLNYMPTDVELEAARKGRTSAKKLVPGLRTTRVGSYPFAEIQFDDMFHDFRVLVPGYQKTYNLLEFNGVDRFTTFLFKPGLKPRLPDMETGKMKILNGRDFHLYLVNWLLDYGWHPAGTVFNVENAMASISRPFEDKLLMWSGGKLTVNRAGISGAPAVVGGWQERAKGNPNAKALKEGLGKLIHGALADQPGQVGPSYDLAPASLAGRTKNAELLLAIAAAVPSIRGKLSLGFLDLAEAVHAVNRTYDELNCRHEHEIEGWDDFIIQEFCANRKTDTWIPMDEAVADLPENERALLGLTLRLDPSLSRPRRLSPAEALLTTAPRLVKLPHEAVPDLLGPEYGETKEVTGGLLNFKIPGIGKLRYHAAYQDADGFRRRLENGASVLVHLNPWKPDFVYLSDPRTNRFLGIAPRNRDVMQNDIEAIRHAHGLAERDFKEAVRETAARHGLSRIPHLRANTAVLREASAPSARERALAAGGFDAGTMLDDPADDHDEPAVSGAAYFDPADLL